MVIRNGETVLGDYPKLKNYIQQIFDSCHPIGEIYVQYPTITDMNGVTRNTVDPMTLYNVNGVTSTWVELNYDGAFFRANGNLAETFGGGIQPEGLPNITGHFDSEGTGQNIDATVSGAFSKSKGSNNGSPGTTGYKSTRFDFSAKNSNAIYGASNNVTPENYTVKVWRRTA